MGDVVILFLSEGKEPQKVPVTAENEENGIYMKP